MEAVNNLNQYDQHGRRQLLLAQREEGQRGCVGSVATALQYNYFHTKDEVKKQYLPCVVNEHRRRYPGAKKVTLVNNLKKCMLYKVNAFTFSF